MNDFFGNAVEKTKAAFDIVVKKTDEVITSGKHLIDIASLENKLKKLYEELGKLYYKSVTDEEDISEAISSKVDEVKKKEEEIELAKKENAEALGKKFCPACEKNVDAKATFCPYCGNKFGE